MPAINPLPTPPSRNDPANFSDRADAFLAALPAYTSEANALLDDVHTSRDTVQGLRNEVIAAGLENAAANAATATTKAAEASASAAEAFGYLQTYRATSYGALANDPVVDPNGNPPTVGDEYFNTTMNLLKRFNGVTWQASDIATANLAAPGGADLVGFDSEHSVKDALQSLNYASQDEVFDLLITYGQSNSVGFAAGQASVPSTLEGRSAITPLGYYWNGSAVVPLIYDMPQSSGEVSTGNAWVPFANEYCRLTGRRLVVIPCAKGGSAISVLQKGGTWYTAMSNYVTACVSWLQSNGKAIGKRWMGFHQGETDQLNLTAESTYVTLLTQLKDDCIADFSLDKFIIHFVGYPQNREETSWDYIINVQRRLVRTHKDVICGFDACASFTKQNGMLTADGVHYSQLGFNLMGAESGRVAAGLVLNLQAQDLRGDPGYTDIKAPKDRFWFAISATLEKISGVWAVKNRANAASGVYSAVSNVTGVTLSSNSQLAITLAASCSSLLCPPVAETTADMRDLGFKFVAELDASGNIIVRCLCDLSFVVKTDGTISSHSGNALVSKLSQLVSASYNSSTQNWTVTIAGNMVGSAIVTPYGTGSNARLTVGSGTTLTVNCPSGDTNKSFSVRMDNVRVNFTDFSNLGPVHVYAVAGQPNW